MTAVRVTYHHELDSWWADSEDVPGWTAAGASLDEVRELTRDGLPFFLDEDSVEIYETFDNGMPVVTATVTGTAATAWGSTTVSFKRPAVFTGRGAILRFGSERDRTGDTAVSCQ